MNKFIGMKRFARWLSMLIDFGSGATPQAQPICVSRPIAGGLKVFPECTECQCYPECRADCADHMECLGRLPEYRVPQLQHLSPQLKKPE